MTSLDLQEDLEKNFKLRAALTSKPFFPLFENFNTCQ